MTKRMIAQSLAEFAALLAPPLATTSSGPATLYRGTFFGGWFHNRAN